MRRAAVLLSLLASLLPGAGQARTDQPVRILAVGDFGVGGSTQAAFGEAVRRFEARNRADLLVTLGDNDYTERPDAFRANWRQSFGRWTQRRRVAIAGVLGNHDVRTDAGRYEYGDLRMPGAYYRRRIGAVELFLLDSNAVGPAQTSWLAKSLAASKARWKLAVFHHPAFSCGSYGSHPGVVASWVPLFERYRVRLVLSGHDHNYQRFAPRRGVRYLVHGGGAPTNLYALGRCSAGIPALARGRVEHGFLYLVVRGARLDGWAVTPDGRRRDHFVARS